MKCKPEERGWLHFKYFEQPEYSELFTNAAIYGALVTVARWVFVPLVADPLGRFALCGSKKTPKDIAMYDFKLRKFREAAWRCAFYTGFCALAVRTIFLGPDGPKPYAFNQDKLIEGWPHEVEDDERFYYEVGFGLFLHQIFVLLISVRMSDFAMMLAHHVVSILMILMSWQTRFTRFGVFVFSIHDFTDIMLESAKLFNSAKAEHPSAARAADVLFGIFAVTFFFFRLGVYPRSILVPVFTVGCREVSCYEDYPPKTWGCGWEWYVFFGVLFSLQLIQVYWAIAIAKVLYRVLVLGEEPEDEREAELDKAAEKAAAAELRKAGSEGSLPAEDHAVKASNTALLRRRKVPPS